MVLWFFPSLDVTLFGPRVSPLVVGFLPWSVGSISLSLSHWFIVDLTGWVAGVTPNNKHTDYTSLGFLLDDISCCFIMLDMIYFQFCYLCFAWLRSIYQFKPLMFMVWLTVYLLRVFSWCFGDLLLLLHLWFAMLSRFRDIYMHVMLTSLCEKF